MGHTTQYFCDICGKSMESVHLNQIFCSPFDDEVKDVCYSCLSRIKTRGGVRFIDRALNPITQNSTIYLEHLTFVPFDIKNKIVAPISGISVLSEDEFEDLVVSVRKFYITATPLSYLEAVFECRREDDSYGYVYLLYGDKGKYEGLFKIGRTKSPKDRVKQLVSVYETDVSLVSLIYTRYSVALEKELHKKYTLSQVSGEWFELDQTAIDYIADLSNTSV